MRTNLTKWGAWCLAKSSYSGERSKGRLEWDGGRQPSTGHTVKWSRELGQELEVGLTGCLHNGRTNSRSASWWAWSGHGGAKLTQRQKRGQKNVPAQSLHR